MDVEKRRELTKRSIQLNPIDVSFVRRERIADGGGGYRNTETILPPQTVRLFIDGNLLDSTTEVGGETQTRRWSLICPWDADVQRGDAFPLDGRQYKVLGVRGARYLGQVVSRVAVIAEVEV